MKARSLSSADFRVWSFVCATLNERVASKKSEMATARAFYVLTKCAGLSPYTTTQPSPQKRHQRVLNDIRLLMCVSKIFMLSLTSIFWHTGNRSETSNITNWIQVRAELTPAVAVHVQLLAFQFIPNAFAFNLISLSCMKSKSLIQDIMISFVGFDVRLKPVIGALPLNRVSNATRRIGNLMSLGTYSFAQQLLSIL